MDIHVNLNPILLMGSLATLLSLWILRPLAASLKLLDTPGGRKTHHAPTPVIGGIALFIGFTVAIFYDNHLLRITQLFWFFSAIILFVGVIDDRHDVSARARLMVQAIGSFGLVIFGHVKLDNLSYFFTDFSVYSYWIILVVSVLSIMAFINAMNMLDGLDGLVGGIALGQSFLLWLVSFKFGSDLCHHLLSIFLCLMLVFMAFNIPLPNGKPARVFLGDAGSTFIAFFLIWVGITLSQQVSVSSPQSITVFWCLLFPFMDLLSVCMIRFGQGRSFLKAGHEHIHHILIRLGMSRPLVSAFICVLSLSIGVIGFGLEWMGITQDFQLILMFGIMFLYVVATYTIYQRIFSASSENTSIAPLI